MACASSEDSDQPGHPPSLIRVIIVRSTTLAFFMRTAKTTDTQADLSLRWMHIPFCWFYHEAAQLVITSFCTATAELSLCVWCYQVWYPRLAKRVWLGLSTYMRCHEIMVLFILRKLILQMRMRSHPVGLDVWFFIELFVYFHTTLCANSEGSGLTAWMPGLARAFAGRLCDKYHNLMSWLTWSYTSEWLFDIQPFLEMSSNLGETKVLMKEFLMDLAALFWNLTN